MTRGLLTFPRVRSEARRDGYPSPMEQGAERAPSARTRTARLGEGGSPVGRSRPLAEPLYQTTVWAFENGEDVDAWYDGRAPGTHLYYRNGNPNMASLEAALADLEGGEAAASAGSGMAAIAAGLLAIVAAGDHILADRACYGGTTVLLREEFARLGIEHTLVDATDCEAVRSAMRSNTRVLHVESISNPLLRCPDLPRLAAIAHDRGALLSVDNTFASPILMRPIAHGADLVTHSLAKYLGGSSVAVGGVLIGTRGLIDAARARLVRLGATIGAFDAWMALQGMKTLALRMEAHSTNARAVARALARHPAVAAVHFPELPGHPDRAIVGRLYPHGCGGMVSFDVGSAAAARAFFAEVGRVGIPLAPSLADTRTTVSYPAGTSHRALSPTERRAIGVTDGLIRLSVGIESADDIVADLDRALQAAQTSAR